MQVSVGAPNEGRVCRQRPLPRGRGDGPADSDASRGRASSMIVSAPGPLSSASQGRKGAMRRLSSRRVPARVVRPVWLGRRRAWRRGRLRGARRAWPAHCGRNERPASVGRGVPDQMSVASAHATVRCGANRLLHLSLPQLATASWALDPRTVRCRPRPAITRLTTARRTPLGSVLHRFGTREHAARLDDLSEQAERSSAALAALGPKDPSPARSSTGERSRSTGARQRRTATRRATQHLVAQGHGRRASPHRP
jgi:hypothetical protein